MDFVNIDYSSLPPEEHEAAKIIGDNLISLQTIACDFRSTVELYMHIRELVRTKAVDSHRKIAWSKIAGVNGAIEGYAFLMVMELINNTRGQGPRLWAKVDETKKREATKLFAAGFPTIAQIRNSSAHPGQLSGEASELRLHGLYQPAHGEGWQFGAGTFVSNMMNADDEKLTLSASFKGKPVSYELSFAKAEVLEKVATLYCEAFYPLESLHSCQMRARLREMD